MEPTWEKLEFERIFSLLEAHNVFLVVVGEGETSHEIERLKELSHPSMTQTHHYLRMYSGFVGPNQTPFMLLEWLKKGNSILERRWLMRHAFSRLNALFKPIDLIIGLKGHKDPLLKIVASDLYFMNSKFDFERHEYKTIKVYHDMVLSSPEIEFRFQKGYMKWVNDNPDEMTSLKIAENLRAFAEENHLSCQIFDRPELEKMGLNLLLSVGQASETSPPKLIIIRNSVEGKPLTLLGKGITFDTGGINLKAFENHVNCMKNDMGGAALMSHIFMAMVTSGYDKPLALVLPCCENLISSRALKPGSVVKGYGGKEVFIEHTDAEGRLILADAISYAERNLLPSTMIVAATLTTAALRQFTGYKTPIYFATDGFRSRLQQAGRKWGEDFEFWGEFLPFSVANRTAAGDLTNMGRLPLASSVGGGSAVAAHFLKEFADTSMVHIDIFASCWNWSGDYPGANYGATGAPFNSLFETLMNI